MSDETKELAIGEEGVIDGVKVRCVEGIRGTMVCKKCCFKYRPLSFCEAVKCSPNERTDRVFAVFQEVK